MAYTPNNPNGQAIMADSEPVVIASDQSAIPVINNVNITEGTASFSAINDELLLEAKGRDLSLTVTNMATGTTVVLVSNDGTNWTNLPIKHAFNGLSFSELETYNGNDTFVASTAPYKHIKIIMTAYTTGTTSFYYFLSSRQSSPELQKTSSAISSIVANGVDIGAANYGGGLGALNVAILNSSGNYILPASENGNLATIASAIKTEDAPHASGDEGVMMFGVATDGDTALSAIGDYTPISTNIKGHIDINRMDELITGMVDETTFSSLTGSLAEAAPTTDTASSGLNGRLQRIAQRITSLITAIGSPFQAGGSIGNTAFGVNNASGASAVNVQDGGNSLTVDNGGTFAVQAAATLAAETTKVIGTVNISAAQAVTANAGTNLNTSALNLETTQSSMSAKLPATLGQKAMAASMAVTLASDQSSIPVVATLSAETTKVIGTVNVAAAQSITANAGTNLNTSALALDTTLTNGTQKAIARGAAKGTTTAADITSTNQSADRQALDVQIRTSAGVAIDSFGGGTQYTEGDTDATIAGGVGMMEIGTNTIQPNQGISGGGYNNLLVAQGATNFIISTVNSTAVQLAASATFTGTIESVFNQQSYSILIVSDQNGTLTVKQYIDAGGTQLISNLSFQVQAGVPFARSGVLNGNYSNITFQNTGASTTTTLKIDTAYGTIPSATQANNAPVEESNIIGSGNLTGSGQAVTLALINHANTTFQLAGTWVGTITFEASLNNTDWTTIFSMKAGDNIIASSVTTNDIYRCTTAGFLYVRARCSAYTSGTIVVTAVAVTKTSGVFLNFPLPAGSNSIGAVSIVESTVLFKGRASTFRTAGRAGTVGQKILSLHNASGSLVTVKINKVFVDLSMTVVKAVTVAPPIIRVWKVTVLPTNGTALTKNKIGGSTNSNASVTVLGDASADGTGSATTLTATLPAGAIITQEFAPRLITAAGYEMADRLEFFSDSTITLGALEGIVVFLDYTLATQNPVTDMWIAGVEWEEITT